MAIVSLALMPNSPLLLPKLSPLVQKKTVKTREALSLLVHELYARQPDIVMLVSYSQSSVNVCSLLQAPSLPYSFAESGDVVTRGEVLIATGFTHSLKESAEVKFPLLLKSVEKLPTNLAVPTWYLSQLFSQKTFVFLELPPQISLEDLKNLSSIVRNHSNKSSRRILLIAVGNLAEQTNKRKDESKIYDKYFQAAINPLNQDLLANLNIELKKQVRESIWAPATLIAEVLADTRVETKVLSYEAPAKAGYLVAQINIV